MLQNRLQSSLIEWYPDHHRPMGLALIDKKTLRWSEHLVYQISGRDVPSSKILVKLPNLQYRKRRRQDVGFQPANAGKLEFEALASIYKHLGDQRPKGVTAVRPLAYFSDIDALVTEYLGGENLLSLLEQAGAFLGVFSNQDAIKQVAFDAGRLLACLHQSPYQTLPKIQVVDVSSFKSKLVRKRDRLLCLYPCLALERRILEAENLIAHLLRETESSVAVTRLHGDYYPENIVRLPDGCVFTVDTTLHQVDPVEEDIAKFLTGVEISKRNLLFGSAGLHKTVAANASRAFLTGYQSVGKCNRRVLPAFQFLAMMQRWIEVLEVMRERLPLAMVAILGRTRIEPSMIQRVMGLHQSIEAEI